MFTSTCRAGLLGAVTAASLATGCGGSSTPASVDAATADAAPQDPVAAVDEARFAADLTAVTGPRTVGMPHWQAVQDLCADRLEALGFVVERHRYATGVNVVGVRAGTTAPDQHVVVSAHYDSVPSCDGADDNATGVAAALEAARVLSAGQHARSLVVACWDEEERGLIGSRAWVARAANAGQVITSSLVFEMIGYRSDTPGSQQTEPGLDLLFPAQTAQIEANGARGDFLLVLHDDAAATDAAALDQVARVVGLPTVVLPVSDMLKRSAQAGGLRRSDHAPFWDVDYPGLMVTDTANYRNPNYHCAGGPDAVADLDLDFAVRGVQVVVGAAAAALDRP
ncbi:MAG: M20/M25/M40 family metallo-hydrolase [Kofleriaceae bacterium]|nr:M20/M25/M40 family metallo-hydrolase [Kofleriaceae bacterium]MBP6840793.1 M20/M25/M40 family metallo-hydrolase [Kofleriaceae bacterium]